MGSKPAPPLSAIAYSPEDAATVTGRSRSRIFKAIKDKELTARKDGKATVLEADSAEGARQILKQYTPDLIISDIGMPDEDGLEFIRKFRRDQTDFIPAIALTAYVRNEEVKEALDAGFQAHIAKPVSKDALFAGIAKVMGLTR